MDNYSFRNLFLCCILLSVIVSTSPVENEKNAPKIQKREGVSFSQMNYIPAFERYYKRNFDQFFKKRNFKRSFLGPELFNGYAKRSAPEAPPASLKKRNGEHFKRSDMSDIVGNLRSIGKSRLTPEQLLIMAMVDDESHE